MRLGDWTTGGTAVVLAALAVAGCSKSKAEEQVAGPEVVSVDKRDLNVTAEASGLVEPIQMVEIKSKASGEVVAVHVQTGQEVTRGALLVQVDPRDVRNALAQSEADLEVAKARAATSDANLKRVSELRKTNVATEQEAESAILEEANARAQLVKARTNLQLAQERMSDVTIRAPLNGTVIEKTIEPGSIIASASGTFGGGTTLLKMADLSVVQVRALVDQTDIGRVEAGQTARVTVEAYQGRPFTGEVVKVEPQAVVDQNVTMFPVLIHLQNDERLLKPGMNTEVEIEIAQKHDIVAVPNDAVVSMRDAQTAGMALGLSENDMKTAMENMRGTRFAAGAGAGAVAVAGRDAGSGRGDGAGSGRGAGAGAGAEASKASAAQGASAPPVSAECSALREKVREAGGPQGMSDADRAKMRECWQGMGGRGENRGEAAGSGAAQSQARPSASSPNRGNAGGFGRGMGAGSRRGTTRRGLVFVPGANGPEPRMVTLGVNDWDYTEVVNGLESGDKVFLMTAARLQQQQKDMQTRMRDRQNMGMRQSSQQQQQQGAQGGGGR